MFINSGHNLILNVIANTLSYFNNILFSGSNCLQYQSMKFVSTLKHLTFQGEVHLLFIKVPMEI